MSARTSFGDNLIFVPVFMNSSFSANMIEFGFRGCLSPEFEGFSLASVSNSSRFNSSAEVQSDLDKVIRVSLLTENWSRKFANTYSLIWIAMVYDL